MTNSLIEIWKDIPGYEGLYQASNLGRIKSLNHSMVQKWKNNKQVFHQYKGRILKGWIQNTGYLTVTLKNKKYSVHRIIALTFLQKAKGKNSVDELNYKALKERQDFNDQWFESNFKEV